MTWHEAATPAEERLPAAPATTQSRQTADSSPTRLASFEVPVCFLVFYWFGIHTAIVPSTAGTRSGGGAVLEKLEGSPARRHYFSFWFVIGQS